ncbi:MAG: MlaE family ABC transporter permease [Bdellovibrionota bacterium]|jgi:phospholipid/cholesterol/gamma-HCH transport system permease protein
MSFVLMVSNGCSRFLNNAGHFVLIFYEGVRSIFRRPFRTQMLLKQIEFIGVNSSFIIVLTGLFTGAVLALQSGKTLRLLNGEGATGSLVALSLLRELGPVMTGLMVAARCGSAMAAEIGTMKVTQQIDALKVMSVDPISYLISPRILATTLIMPFLNLIFCMMGLFGSYLVAIGILNINEAIYFDKIQQYVGTDDLWNGMVKSVFFGMIVSTVGCRMGYVTSGGAEGVGRSTTQAVVIASVSILVADYFLTAVMF